MGEESGEFVFIVAQVCEALERVIATSFGPYGRDKLLVNDTSKMLITNSGYTILGSLVVTHPVARTILDSIRVHNKRYGDGTCSIILMLSSAARGIAKKVSLIGRSSQPLAGKVLPRERLRRRAHLRRITWGLDALESALIRHPSQLLLNLIVSSCRLVPASDKVEVRANLTYFVTTMLSGKFGADAVAYLSAMLVDLVLRCQRNHQELHEVTSEMLRSFPFVLHAGAALHHSHFLGGIVLEHSFATRSSPSIITTPCLLVLHCTVREELPKSGRESINAEVDSAADYDRFLKHQDREAMLVVQQLASRGVTLLVSSRRLHESTLQWCDELGISVVHAVPQSTTRLIARYAGTFPVSLLRVEDIPSLCLGSALGCAQISVGGQALLQLEFDKDTLAPSCIAPHTLVLRGPIEGMCRQYSEACRRCIKALGELDLFSISAWTTVSSSESASTTPRAHSLLLSPGGGALEVTLGSFFEALATYTPGSDGKDCSAEKSTAAAAWTLMAANKGPDDWRGYVISACRIMEAAMLAIPLQVRFLTRCARTQRSTGTHNRMHA
jgi:chaperonin GroEL (HSP60 family)